MPAQQKAAKPLIRYRVTLTDRDRSFDLGLFEGAAPDEAIKRAKKEFRGLFGRLALECWTTQARPE